MKSYKDIHRKYSNPSDDVTFFEDNDKKLEILYPDARIKWGQINFCGTRRKCLIFYYLTFALCNMNFSRKSNVRCRSTHKESFHGNCRNCEDCPKRKLSTGCYRCKNKQDFQTIVSISEEELDDTESIISSEGQDGDAEQDINHHSTALQIQEVWLNRDVKKSLNSLPGSQEIQALMAIGNLKEASTHQNSSYTGILLASYYGNNELLELILKQNFPVNVRDSEGRTPLHLAACVGAADCVKTLLRYKAMVNVWDKENSVTPLHCAASSGSLPCLKMLIEAGANIQAGLTTTGSGKPPLHYAVQSNSISCVEELLKHGASANIFQVYTETPLHIAASMGYSTCLKILLEHGADHRVRFGPAKSTPLHLAAEDGNAECAKLLLEAGADINAMTAKNQTPLHLAALAQSAQTLELLLMSKADPNAEDVDKRTPLHCAIVKGSRSCECVQLLLQHGAKVNAADVFGYTPVHIAALNEFSSCLRLLLDNGGDVTRRTNGKVSALSFIARRTPEILPYLEYKLDQGIKLHDHEIGDVDCEIKLDFRILVPNMSSGETGLLLTFIEVGQRQILKHPLCEIFLHLKWRRIRKYFILSLIIHALYVCFCSVYILNVFLDLCEVPHNESTEKNLSSKCLNPIQRELARGHQHCPVTFPFLFLEGLLFLCNLSIVIKEIFQIAHIRKKYVYQWENWLQWLIIFSVFITLIPPHWLYPKYVTWQHHVSVFGIFFNWIELMVLIGRFPMFGLYVQMFTTGAINFGKFLLAYFCLLAAFTFSFRMLFSKYHAFKDIITSTVKIVAMMTGELEFEDIFRDDEPEECKPKHMIYPGTAHLFFLFFTLIVTVVLTNLLVGLSVSDIQGLQKSAGLDRLVRQAELVAYMESMLFSRLLHWIPKKILAICHKSALLLSSPRQYTLIIRPNDPREKRIPAELVKAAYKCVSERKALKYKNRSYRKGNYSMKNDSVKRGFRHSRKFRMERCNSLQ